jgi:hypothetical protein
MVPMDIGLFGHKLLPNMRQQPLRFGQRQASLACSFAQVGDLAKTSGRAADRYHRHAGIDHQFPSQSNTAPIPSVHPQRPT